MKNFRSLVEQRKSSAKVDDRQESWLRVLTYETPTLEHLYQPPKSWQQPKGIRLIKHSRRKQSALDYERIRKIRRGEPFTA